MFKNYQRISNDCSKWTYKTAINVGHIDSNMTSGYKNQGLNIPFVLQELF